jgi:hypothetical protein
MHSSPFNQLLEKINSSLKPISENQSKFETCLKNILKEQEEMPPAPQPITPPADPNLPAETPELPTQEDLASIEILKVAVAALFVELPSEIEKNSTIRQLSNDLNDLKPISPDNTDQALEIIKKILVNADIPIDFSLDKLPDIDFATKNVLVNLAVNALFVSKSQIQDSDPSIETIISKIAEQYSVLKSIEKQDPIQALQLSKDLKQEIQKIVSSMDFSVDT